MQQSVLFVDASGNATIDPSVLMEEAIKLVFKTTDPADMDPAQVSSDIGRMHGSLLGVAAKLLARGRWSISTAPDTVHSESAIIPPIAADEPAARAVQQVLPFEDSHGLSPTVTRMPERPRTPARPKRATSAAPKPIAEVLDLVQSIPVAPVEMPKRRRADLKVAAEPDASKLPRRLSTLEDALRMDSIVCLEDGKAVQDLGKHLLTLGMTPQQYLTKWRLPSVYPMKAPSFIQKKGVQYEYDPVNKQMIRV